MNIILHDPVMEAKIDERDERLIRKALTSAGAHRCLGLPGAPCDRRVSANKPRCFRCAVEFEGLE